MTVDYDQQLQELYRERPDIKNAVSNFLQTGGVDMSVIDACKKYVEQGHYNCDPERKKYANHYELFLARNMRRALDLGLNTSPPLRILDIGCGGTIFPAIAKHFGHEVVATDLDIEDEVFTKLANAHGVERTRLGVTPFQNLPDMGGKFDLVTGFATCFNHDYINEVSWGGQEWNHFLEDVRLNQIKPNGGKLYLELNIGLRHGQEMPADVSSAFASHGAEIDGFKVTLTNTPKRHIDQSGTEQIAGRNA